MTETALTQSHTIAGGSEVMSEGDVAASVFERFDLGASPEEVVIDLVLAVDTVECLWLRLPMEDLVIQYVPFHGRPDHHRLRQIPARRSGASRSARAI